MIKIEFLKLEIWSGSSYFLFFATNPPRIGVKIR
jgi:hypothetical protein